MASFLFKNRHWKVTCIAVLSGIITAHIVFNGLHPWSGFGSSMVIWSGQGGLTGHKSLVKAREVDTSIVDHMDAEDVESSKHLLSSLKLGHVRPDVDLRSEREVSKNVTSVNKKSNTGNSEDDVVVGAVPYHHDDDDDDGELGANKPKDKRIASGRSAPRYDFQGHQIDEVADEGGLEEVLLKDSVAEDVKIELPKPGERYKKAVYYYEGPETNDADIFDDNIDVLSMKQEDNSFVDIEEDFNEADDKNAEVQQEAVSVESGIDEMRLKNEADTDGAITDRRSSLNDAHVLNGSDDVKITDTRNGHAQYEMEPDQGFRLTKLIILTYMRSGSSYVGNLLERSPQVFYFYEPLYSTQINFGHWDKFRYLDGHNISQSVSLETNSEPNLGRNRTRGAPPAYFRTDSIAVRMLKAALDCRLCDLDLDTLSQVTMGHGVRTVGLKLCTEGGSRTHDLYTVRQCCSNASAICRKTLTVAAKVIRLSMQQARILMEEDESVKLLHLIRDPRGMSESQVYRRFYPWEFHREVAHFCSRMWQDLQQHAKLAQSFPLRTLLVRYEDVVREPVAAMQQIYDFAGIRLSRFIQRQAIRKSKDKKRPYMWREKIGAKRAAVVEKHCAPMFHVMGYREFPDENSLTNTTFDSVDKNFADGWPGAVVLVDDQPFV